MASQQRYVTNFGAVWSIITDEGILEIDFGKISRLVTSLWLLVVLNPAFSTHLPLDKNGHHCTDDIFIHIFLNENVRIFIKFSLKFDGKSPIGHKSALAQVMACRLFGAKPLPEPMLSQFTDAYMPMS